MAGGFDLTADVALSGGVVGEQHIARPEAAHRSIPELDLHRAAQRDDELAPWRRVEVDGSAGRSAPEDHASRRYEPGEPAVLRLVLGDLEVLEVRLAVVAGVDPRHLHARSVGTALATTAALAV